jgi:phosphonate transport system substrate-binding protein
MSSASRSIARRQLLAALASIAGLGCARQEPDVQVDLTRPSEPEPARAQSRLRFAIGTMLAPRESIRAYKQLAEYLVGRIGHAIEIVQRRSYGQTNALLEKGDADFGFICTGAYVAMKPEPPEILAAPVVHGKLTYASYIIVRSEDPATDLESLRGSSFAFVDPISLTGRIYPEWAARQVEADAGPLFAETSFTYSHSHSIELVASGRVRAAGIDSVVFEQVGNADPTRIAPLRVLQRSPEFGMPPFVSGARLAPALRQLLRKTLLRAHLSIEGLQVLRALGFDRFALPEPRYYEPALRMRGVLHGTGGGTLP